MRTKRIKRPRRVKRVHSFRISHISITEPSFVTEIPDGVILQVEPALLDVLPEGDRPALFKAFPVSEIQTVAEDEPFPHVEIHAVRENGLGLRGGIVPGHAVNDAAVLEPGFPVPPGPTETKSAAV